MAIKAPVTAVAGLRRRAAVETAAAFALLADVLRGQLLEYTRFAEPAEPSASARLRSFDLGYIRAFGMSPGPGQLRHIGRHGQYSL